MVVKRKKEKSIGADRDIKCAVSSSGRELMPEYTRIYIENRPTDEYNALWWACRSSNCPPNTYFRTHAPYYRRCRYVARMS